MRKSQQTMLPHSEVKIDLLRRYLIRYLNILSHSQWTRDVHIYDIFCGEGVYENQGKGSPLAILEPVKDIHFSNKSKNIAAGKLHCHFNDKETWKVEKLQNEVIGRKLHYEEMGNLSFSTLDYHSILSTIIPKINLSHKNDKSFVFVDPYGYKEVRVSDIANLLASKKTEVLLFLPTQFMFRFENKGTPECLHEFIGELMPKEQWPLSDTGLDFIENLTDAFRNRLGAEYFVDSFIITRDRNQFFCLFFFTSHIYGFDKMLETKWSIDAEEGRGWQYHEGGDLFSQIPQKPNTYKFEKKLGDFLREERTNGELYEFCLQQGHLTSHASDILVKLQKEGRLAAQKEDGTDARKSSFYLNYRDYKASPRKIKVKIK